ncbi:hypothetical protein CC86DRAFT_154950 [Ophiobolus disseminans]|uniref:Uncharacterized protein n=1 Tax=Ophiobolus disseminans TaxID=1469910 RepID=A0A6A6ZBZ5_9PLEO|nr:hypothetical protein CC86DRAFT_154950 [Ophiobolus disseminans]
MPVYDRLKSCVVISHGDLWMHRFSNRVRMWIRLPVAGRTVLREQVFLVTPSIRVGNPHVCEVISDLGQWVVSGYHHSDQQTSGFYRSKFT